jgi:hypothetical protein
VFALIAAADGARQAAAEGRPALTPPPETSAVARTAAKTGTPAAGSAKAAAVAARREAIRRAVAPGQTWRP